MDEKGWPDIAYTFLINHEGLIYEGVPPGFRGTHTAGHNTSGHAICLLGNFNTTQPTEAALESLVSLIEHGHNEEWWPEVLTGGHRDTRGNAVGDCPGNKLYALIPEINEELTMPTIEEIREAIRSETPSAVLAAQFGGPVGSSKRKTFAEHVLNISALVGALDAEGVSETELDAVADRIIASVPDEVLVRLKAKL
jgi:hypothetical protein